MAHPTELHPALVVPTSREIQESPETWAETWRTHWEEVGVHPEWARLLASAPAMLGPIGDKLAAHLAAGEQVLPAPTAVLRALSAGPDEVRVLIVGQDPYPTPGHPIGLSFATERHVAPLPRSLGNIYRELHDDVGVAIPSHGDLSAWQRQGVMLLNRSLTVAAGTPASHADVGWEALTEAVVGELGRRRTPLVGILWGRQAQRLRPLLGEHPAIESAHPSPLSASRGFFGSRPFSRANDLLREQGAEPIDWAVPD